MSPISIYISCHPRDQLDFLLHRKVAQRIKRKGDYNYIVYSQTEVHIRVMCKTEKENSDFSGNALSHSQLSQCFAQTFGFKMKHSSHFIISGQESRSRCQNVLKARTGVSSCYLKEVQSTVAGRVLLANGHASETW